jgi:hypothetical protein
VSLCESPNILCFVDLKEENRMARSISKPLGVVLATLAAVGVATPVTAFDAQPARAQTATSTADPAASNFTVFDNTSYNNDNLPANYGLTPSAVVYDSWSIKCASTSTYSCNLPSQADYQAKIKALAATVPASAPLTLDFEGIVSTGGTPWQQVANNCQAWKTLVSWTRAVIPADQPLGNYAYDWNTPASALTCNQQLHQSGLTFFAPSLYTYSSDLSGANWTSWTQRVDQSIANDAAVAPGQPVYPYIWPEWDISGNGAGFMDADSWLNELDYLKTAAQGAILWSGTRELDSGACGWLEGTRAFMAGVNGRNTSSGALTVDTEFPDTCTLTRGTTTDVPITVTNTGSSASAPTTLTIIGTGGVSGAASSAKVSSHAAAAAAAASVGRVPAIAAGGTWSTTVRLAVGADASLGDSVLGFDFGDAGTQYAVALVKDIDLAADTTATQSSTNGSQAAGLAVDSSTTTYSQTGTAAQPWWQTDLGSTKTIGGIDLWPGAAAPSDYYVVVSDTASPAVQTAPLAPNQWIETSPGTWVMNVYNTTFRWLQWKGDTGARSMSPSTDIPVPAGITGRYVRVQLRGTGQLSLGAVQVTPGQPDGPQLLSTNVVANGGFDAGVLEPWLGSGALSTGTTTSGSHSIALGQGASVYQTVHVEPNTTYTLSGYIQPLSGNGVELGVKNFGGSQTVSYTSATGWTRATVTFTTGPTNTTADIFAYHNIGSGTAYADDITCAPSA